MTYRNSIIIYLVAGLILMAAGITMMISPQSLGTISMALVSIYLIADGIRTLLDARSSDFPKWFFIVLSARNGLNIAGGTMLLITGFAFPDLLFTVLVYIAGAILVLTTAVNITQYFLSGRRWIIPGTFINFALALILFIYPSVMGKPGFAIAAAAILALGAVSFAVGCCRIKASHDISSLLVDIGRRESLTKAEMTAAIERNLLHRDADTPMLRDARDK